MHPAFALSFSSDGLSLLHCAEGDWYPVGTVNLDADDLDDQIKALRDKAFALENDLSCELVLPADQVRFLSIDDGAPVRDALAEATPYDPDDLAYDTVTQDETTFIAAVAMVTLDEARDFAQQHGFIPVQFTAPTEGQPYPAKPQFSRPDPEPEPLPVHAIADSETAQTFRSAPSDTKQGLAKPLGIAAAAATVALLGWWLIGPAEDVQTSEIAPLVTPQSPEHAEATPVEPEADPDDDLSATDQAILEAIELAPTQIERVAPDPQPEDWHTGSILAPAPLVEPPSQAIDDLYLSSLDRSDLSRDAVALPDVAAFDTDDPFDQSVLPGTPGQRFVLDERGLVTPTPEGTLNPDGVVVFLGRPSKVPPAVPVRFEQEPIEDDGATRLAELRPKPRPDNLVERFERQQLGGRSRQELAVLRPKARPKSVQEQPQVDQTPTALAVVRVPRPKLRPAGLKAPRASGTGNLGSTAALSQSSDEAGSFQPKTVAPKIPSSASVTRQATIDNAINLRKLNLIGVFGTPANRRALVRLPSGRYKKLKVGDRLDGGNVIAIGDSELRYQKRGKNVTLKMPRG